MSGPTAVLGKVHVITGDGRGKTTAAFGLALRAAGHGLRVCVVQFMKTREATGEVIAAKRLGNIDVAQFGTGRFVEKGKLTERDRECARAAIERARAFLAQRKCDVLILDEVNVAVYLGALEASDVVDLLDSRPPGVEVVLTGRRAPEEFIKRADYVSVIESGKHPFDEGLGSRKGIEW